MDTVVRFGIGTRIPGTPIGVGVGTGGFGCLPILAALTIFGAFAEAARFWPLWLLLLASYLTFRYLRDKNIRAKHEPHRQPGGYQPDCPVCVDELNDARDRAQALHQLRAEQAEWDHLNRNHTNQWDQLH